MKYRKALFLLVYSRTKKGFEYLILKRKLHWKGWEFPKGGVEDSERDNMKTIKRELKEETGLKPLWVKDFKISGKYKYEKELSDRMGYIGQTYHLYAIKVKKEKPSIDTKEHSKAEWVNYKTAMDRLTWDDQKKCLKKVNEWLKKMKFREMELDSGKIVLMGRNDNENEKLMQEFMGEDKLVMHTVESGSPFCVALTKPSKISKKDKKQMAILCSAYSQDWRKHKQDVKVHVFSGKDVYKKSKMKKGTFGVKKPEIIVAKKQDIKKVRKIK
ncbi:DUF814 domain-containing protein [Candidatus Pacearchaeota archaeon]|nr:DUF814 domain-containing protein [Candidatus Pacearchaeota archaeon]